MKNEIRSLTGLRGLSAFWVVGFHISQSMPNLLLPPLLFNHGGIGVEVFFVLSGFIITRVHDGMRTPEWHNFFVRRIFRIYPLHLAVISLLAMKVILSHTAKEPGGYYSWRALPYVVTLTSTTFGFSADLWNVPTWSLDVELVCYFLFPFIMLLLVNLTPGRALALLVIFIGLDVISLTNINTLAFDPKIEGIKSFERGISGFASGIFLYFATQKTKSVNSYITLAVFIGLLMVACSPFAMFCPIFIAPLIGLLAFDRGLIASVMSSRSVWSLGQISFSIYLIHTPLINVLSHTLTLIIRYTSDDIAKILCTLLMLLTIVLLSRVSYYLIEKPGKVYGNRFLN